VYAAPKNKHMMSLICDVSLERLVKKCVCSNYIPPMWNTLLQTWMVVIKVKTPNSERYRKKIVFLNMNWKCDCRSICTQVEEELLFDDC